VSDIGQRTNVLLLKKFHPIMVLHEFQFTSADGLKVACARWNNRKPGRGVIQIAHGLGEHMGRYQSLIEALVRAGLIVYANDHRGHGKTARSHEESGDFGPGGFNLLVDDMVQLSEIIKSENTGQQLILFGHSMGSFAAQQYVLDHSRLIDGLVLSGTGALDGLAHIAKSAQPGENFLNAAFVPVRTPFDWLSRDPAIADSFMSDPLCFESLQSKSMRSFLAAFSQLANPCRLKGIRRDLPVYLFSGGDDPVGQKLTGVNILMDRYRQAGLINISHHFYPGGRHEMLNEINSSEVRRNLFLWLSCVLNW
jgi:alpha-beta hydrolase superfamily lysophospholipase